MDPVIKDSTHGERASSDNSDMKYMGGDLSEPARLFGIELLQYRLRYESLIATIAARFLHATPSETSAAIEQGLAHIGEFLEADRCHLLLNGMPEGVLTTRYGWNREQIPSPPVSAAILPISIFPPWDLSQGASEPAHVILQKQTILNASRNPLIEARDCHSLAAVPLILSQRLFGVLIVEAVQRPRMWDADTITLLHISGDLFTNALARCEAEERQTLLNSALEASESGILLCRRDGLVVWSNPAINALTGYDPVEVVGCSLSLLHHSSDWGPMWEAIYGGHRWQGEGAIRRKDGETRYEEISVTPLPGPEGRSPYVVITKNDISARKRAEMLLYESEQKYRVLVESAGALIAMMDDTGIVRFINKVGADLLGGQPADYIGVPIDQVIAHDVAEHECTLMRYVLDNGVGISDERQVGLGNLERWFQLRLEPVPDPGHDPTQVLLFALDITDRKRAEQALRESEERYRSLVEHAPEAIIVAEVGTGHLRDANTNAEILFGLPRRELLDKCIVDISLRPQPGGMQAQSVWEACALRTLNEDSVLFEWTFRNVMGYDIPCEVLLVRLPPVTGGLVRASITDITSRIFAQQTIAEQRARMISSARLSSLGEMAGGLAHEINNPLAIISVACEQLRNQTEQGLEDPAQTVATVDRITRNIDRIERIVRGLRTISRDGSGDPFVERSVRTLIEETLELCAARFQNHGIELRVEPVPGNLTIECRATEIAQVLLNLLSNAHDAVEDTGYPWVALEVSRKDGMIRFTVTDSGPGLPPDLEQRVFEPFFTTKQSGKGTGLGLSISKSLIEGHGGRFYLETASARTQFVVELPARQGKH